MRMEPTFCQDQEKFISIFQISLVLFCPSAVQEPLRKILPGLQIGSFRKGLRREKSAEQGNRLELTSVHFFTHESIFVSKQGLQVITGSQDFVSSFFDFPFIY